MPAPHRLAVGQNRLDTPDVLDQDPAEKKISLGDGNSVTSLLRNLNGSAGISLITNLVTRGTYFGNLRGLTLKRRRQIDP